MSDSRLAGWLAMAATVLIWAAWIVGTRQVLTAGDDRQMVGLIRFAVPALFFLPAILRRGLWPASVAPRLVVFVILSGGPFFLLVSTAMRIAPAAEIAPLLPGTMPLLVALLAFLVDKEPFGRWRVIGFALVLAGGLAIFGRGILAAAESGVWIGHLCAVSAAFLWACFTVAFRRTGFSSAEATGIAAAWAALAFLPFGLLPLMEAVGAARWGALLWHVLLQGVLSGIASIWLYVFAVGRLGASRAAAVAALTPGLATLLAIPWLGEWPDGVTLAGVALTSLGVLLASGVLETWSRAFRRRPPLPDKAHGG